jgi:hypothetical protein
MLHLVPRAGARRKVADVDRHVEQELVRALFRVLKSQAADREIADFMTVPRSCPA